MRYLILLVPALLAGLLIWSFSGSDGVGPSAPTLPPPAVGSDPADAPPPEPERSAPEPAESESNEPPATGRVVDAEGRPFGPGTVRFVPEGRRETRATKLRPDGTFDLPHLQRGPHRMEVVTNAWGKRRVAAAKIVSVDQGEAFAKTVVEDPWNEAAGPLLTVRVHGPNGPVAQGRVVIHNRGPRSCLLTDGFACYPVETPGRDVWLEVLSCVAANGTKLEPRWLGPFPLRPGERKIVLRPARTIRGRVESGAGATVAGATVWAIQDGDRSGPNGWIFQSIAESGPGGGFVLEGIGDGLYRLRAGGKRVVPPHRPSDPFYAGADEEVVLRLRPGARATVTVLGPNGKPLAGAQVHVLRYKSRFRHAVADEAGVARVDGLDPDIGYRLCAAPPKSTPGLGLAILEPWHVGDVTLTLPRVWNLKGRIVDADSRFVPEWAVYWRGPGGDWTYVRSDDAGRFTIDYLTAETIEVKAVPPGGTGAEAAAVKTVAAGTHETTLTVDTGTTMTIRVADLVIEKNTSRWAGLYEDGNRSVRRGAVAWRQGPVFTFRGVRRDKSYTFEIVGCGGRAASESGLRPGPDEIVVKLDRGVEIHGRVEIPPGTRPRLIFAKADRGHSTGAAISRDGSFVISGLLPGEWTVDVALYSADGNRLLRAEARVSTGDTVVLVPKLTTE